MVAPKYALVVTVMLALAAASCSSDASDPASVAAPTGEPAAPAPTEAVAEEQPVAVGQDDPPNTIRLFFDLIPLLDDPMSEVTAFKVAYVDVDPIVELGFLDENASIALTRDDLGGNFMIQAETPNDPLCWWTAFASIPNTTPDGFVIAAELEMECA